jgi:hypothetical protein
MYLKHPLPKLKSTQISHIDIFFLERQQTTILISKEVVNIARILQKNRKHYNVNMDTDELITAVN